LFVHLLALKLQRLQQLATLFVQESQALLLLAQYLQPLGAGLLRPADGPQDTPSDD
jgi:hypothetical protein